MRLLGLLSAALVLAAPAAAQCPGTDDSFEDNDDCASAWTLVSGSYPGLYTEKEALDSDHFLIHVPAGDYLRTTATFVHDQGDVDLVLWDATCATVVDSSKTVTDDEEIVVRNASGVAVDYVLDVHVWSGDDIDCNDYDLVVDVFPDPCPGLGDDALEDNDTCSSPVVVSAGTHPGLIVHKTDPDFYRLTVPAGDRVTATASFDHADGDVDLALWDLGCSSLLDLSSTSSDVETCAWLNSTGSAVDVVVEANVWTGSLLDCNTYDLDLTTVPDPCLNPSDDMFEENDDCSSAVSGVFGLHTDLFVSKTDKDHYTYNLLDGGKIDVDALFTHASGDIDLILYDATDCGGGLGEGLEQSASVSDDESLSWTNGTGVPVDVVLEVNVFDLSDLACNDYDLDVTVSGSGSRLGDNYCGPANLNSSGKPAVISAFGSLLVSANSVRLDASQMPANQFGMFLNSMTTGFFGPPGSQGNLCLSGSIGRYNSSLLNTGSTGEFSLQLDLTNTPTPSGPVSVQPGETWYFQAWFRDKNPTNTSNFTDGVEIAFQ